MRRLSWGLAAGLVGAVLAYPASAEATQAQPMPIPEDQGTAPQLDVAGVGVATLGYGAATGGPGINFSDSALVVGAAERLFDSGAIGSFGLGGLTLDQTNRAPGNPLFLQQAFADYQAETFEVLVGRSDMRTAHRVDFPTLRGDDLIDFTGPLNPYSNGQNPEEHRYGNVAAVTLNQQLTWFEDFHVQHLIDSAGTASDAGINAVGASLEYLGMPGLSPFERFPSWGVGAELLPAYDRSPVPLGQIYAGGVLNLNQSTTDLVDLRAEDVLTVGSALTSFQGAADPYQANADALAASLRYLHTPYGGPGFQLALTGGYKTYFQVGGARSLGAALTGVRQLGQGFDLVAQYQAQWREAALAAIESPGVAYEQTVEVGLTCNFDATINGHLSPRRSLLNMQHHYIPN